MNSRPKLRVPIKTHRYPFTFCKRQVAPQEVCLQGMPDTKPHIERGWPRCGVRGGRQLGSARLQPLTHNSHVTAALPTLINSP
ncbi:hypothetical protein J6590_047613 [Homalodisca vitripennis]|nr:hypothetical protein J6590_047613 [Homalodisca vitripennis]